MDGRGWLSLVLILVVVGFALAGLRRRRFAAEQGSRHCPHCDTPMSMRRVSWLKSFLFLAAWECPHCGTRSRLRKRVKGAVT
jgi:hypothetical protein